MMPRRPVAVLGAALLAVIGVPGVASATSAEADDCAVVDGYAPAATCDLVVSLDPVCLDTVPVLRYAAEVRGTTAQTVMITWINPDGPDLVYDDLPLSGELLWPGVVLGEDGTPEDWPGWTRLPDGTLQPGDQYDWTLRDVLLSVEANPVATGRVSYPSAAGCYVDSAPSVVLSSSVQADTPTLATTGAGGSTGLMAGAAGLLVLGGALVLWAVRRRA